MVVKPLAFIHRGGRGVSQPAVKCRGREYLRIIYGPDYTTEANLVRLRFRGLGRKRSLALGEFALGVEGLERFVRREPLRRVHECVFWGTRARERTSGPEALKPCRITRAGHGVSLDGFVNLLDGDLPQTLLSLLARWDS
jgi:PNKP adenylyltransferase domain, C-terminal region/PNKP adenylyltransferase domain, ligase domain